MTLICTRSPTPISGSESVKLAELEARVAALEPKPGIEPTTAHLAEVLDTLRWAIQAHSQSSGWIPA